MEYLFVFLFLLLAYVYIGYPVALAAAGIFRVARTQVNILPSVTLFIPAHNEGRVIEQKILNSLDLDYPKESLEIVVATDACSDDTVQIAASFRHRGVMVMENRRREGKNGVINEFVPECKGDIIVFSDANSFYEKNAVRKLVRSFADDRVGCVVGNLRYAQDNTSVGKGEGLYFRYESLLKKLESRFGTVVTGTGSIYAIRKALFRPIDLDVPNDFVHPIQIAAEGYEVVFEPEAVAVEKPTSSASEEYRRRVRIVSRSFTAFMRYWQRYRMLRGFWGFCFFSHKLLRWFIPFLLIALFVTNISLESPFFRMTLYSQVVFYFIASIAPLVQGRATRLVTVPFYFCLINCAALIGIMRSVRGRAYAIWEPAQTTR